MYFSFCPTKRIYGEQSIRALMRELKSAERIGVVASGSAVHGTSIMNELDSVSGRIVFQKVLSGQGEPDYRLAASLAEEFSSHHITHIICIGGGSIIDLTKAAALMAQFEGNAEEKWGSLVSTPFDATAIPLVVVSTVPGTSSESNSTFVISDPKGYKKAIARIGCFPLAMAFDPVFSVGVSVRQLHLGMFDALMHVLEQSIRPELVCLTNDGLCISMVATLLDLHHRLLVGSFEKNDLVRYSRISSVIIDGSLLGRGVHVDSVTHEIATFLSCHFEMAHGATLACVLPEYLDHPANRSKKARFESLMAQSVSAVNLFYGQSVIPDVFDLHQYISETGIVESCYVPLGGAIEDAEIVSFMNERDAFWSQKSVDKIDAEKILRTVLKNITNA